MAHNDTLVSILPLAFEPAQTGATVGSISTGSNLHPTLDFPTGQNLFAWWTFGMPNNYANNGLNIYIFATCDVQVGNIQWSASFERMDPAHFAMNIDNSAAANLSDIQTAPSAAFTIGKNTISVADGANMSSIQPGDLFRIKLARNDSVGSDASGTVHFLGAEIREA